MANWTLDGYKAQWGSNRVFRTRAEARRFVKIQKMRPAAIVKTLNMANSAMDDWELYDMAPDGSYFQRLPDHD